MKQEIINLYDRYTHSEMDRRTFLERLALMVGGSTMASQVLRQLENNYALAKSKWEGLSEQNLTFASPAGPIQAFLAQKDSTTKKPGVVVIHENRGLNPYVQDVARQLANDGFLALAPDGLSLSGGTPTDSDLARQKIGELEPEQAKSIFVAAIQYLGQHANCSG
ncbi:MAG: dienelactone hydrolase family protein, partial [Acidobacteria bacterium]|nr:dienelactone hydrolase family protein [Acidobacteriota bacterium]